MNNLHYGDFLSHLNSRFQMTAEDGSTHELELVQVTENSPSPRQEQFVLQFRAPLTAPSSQSIYELQHEQLGSGSIFLVPVNRKAEGLFYEAVFNRPIERPIEERKA